MKSTNPSGFLTSEVTGGKKSCFESNTFLLEKSLKDCSNVQNHKVF